MSKRNRWHSPILISGPLRVTFNVVDYIATIEVVCSGNVWDTQQIFGRDVDDLWRKVARWSRRTTPRSQRGMFRKLYRQGAKFVVVRGAELRIPISGPGLTK
jgi:hypothetical protein